MPDEIVGISPAVARFRRDLPMLAHGAAPIILTGEEGVGKSFFASHLHAAGPHVAAFPESLNFSILSGRDQRIELLGAEPPELTTSKKSVLERKTSVVLKHIDKTNGFLQDALADALSCHRIIRLGATQPRPVAARVIFTFRRPIAQLEKSNTLTPKLLRMLYPLKSIHLPPLRRRREDVQLLARNYALKLYTQYQHGSGVCIRGIARDGTIEEDLAQLLRSSRWEGNIRQLHSFLRMLALLPLTKELHEREKLEVFRMVGMIEEGEEFSLPLGLVFIERALVERAANRSNQHKSGVAKLLGISERALGRRIPGIPRSSHRVENGPPRLTGRNAGPTRR
jgi:DNA-binding NtrC family response regulator